MVTPSVRRIVMAMSGGVDSAISCLSLKMKGYDVQGVYMENWGSHDEVGHCTGEQDYQDACKAAEIIGVPLKRVNFEKEYWNYVFIDTLRQYAEGFTPNPDIFCNKHIKFGFLFNHAFSEMGADWFATGHYARLHYNLDGKVKLLKAVDAAKDQSYFLSHVQPEALQKTLFPIGGLLKTEVKDYAKKYGLAEIAKRPEYLLIPSPPSIELHELPVLSYGICFIGKRDFPQFIDEYVAKPAGPMVDVDTGLIIKKHNGIHHWTVGQRIRKTSTTKKHALKSIAFTQFDWTGHIRLCPPKSDQRNHTNQQTEAGGRDHPALDCQTFVCINPHWLSSDHRMRLVTAGSLKCQCRTRYQHTPDTLFNCVIQYDKSGDLVIELERPVSGNVAPGQFAVFYDGEECLGGAMIKECTGKNLEIVNQAKVKLEQVF